MRWLIPSYWEPLHLHNRGQRSRRRVMELSVFSSRHFLVHRVRLCVAHTPSRQPESHCYRSALVHASSRDQDTPASSVKCHPTMAKLCWVSSSASRTGKAVHTTEHHTISELDRASGMHVFKYFPLNTPQLYPTPNKRYWGASSKHTSTWNTIWDCYNGPIPTR